MRDGRQIGRRAFFVTGMTGTVGLLAGSQTLVARAGFSNNPFTLGIASGDPTSDSVILWTRLAPEPLEDDGGMPPTPVLVRWRVANDEGMTRVVRQGLAIAWPGLAHSVRVKVSGLQPDGRYLYQFDSGGAETIIGRTCTLPAPGAPSSAFRFAFASCQSWQDGLYPAYRNMALEDLDLVVHLGDYIYEHGVNPSGIRQHDGPETTSLAAYRRRYALYKTDPHLQAAHAAFPWLAVPDDYEVDNNYAGASSEDGVDWAQFLARRAHAYQAYYEHMPLGSKSFPLGPWMQLYRGLTVGDLLEFSALDTRQYRSHQPCGSVVSGGCPGSMSPFQTMTGPTQERWLLDRLDRSSARWNVIAQQVMFSQFDLLPGGGKLFNMDQWDGYVAARNRITGFLADRRPSNPIIITGDYHSSWVHDIRADFNDSSSATLGTEFVGTSITSQFASALIGIVEAAVTDNPHTHFFDGRYRGYVRCAVDREQWRTDFRAVPTVMDDSAEAFMLASFVVEDGQQVVAA